MIKALQNYCGITAGCGPYQPDIDPQFIQTFTADISGYVLGYATYPQGFKVPAPPWCLLKSKFLRLMS